MTEARLMTDAYANHDSVSGRRSRSRSCSREYRAIYALTFPVFFLAACAKRISAPASPTNDRSIYGEAKKLASASIPMAFMG